MAPPLQPPCSLAMPRLNIPLYWSGGWPLLALSGGVLAYILQLQTWVTTLTTGVTFWAILGVSVAIMRIQSREQEKGQTLEEKSRVR